jgi:hypothetical protein
MSALVLCVLVVVFRGRKGIEKESRKLWLKSNRGSKSSNFVTPIFHLSRSTSRPLSRAELLSIRDENHNVAGIEYATENTHPLR